MRKFAELDENNTVIRVLIANDQTWLEETLGGVWVESFDDGTRVRRAGAGFTYDAERDAFIPPKSFDSWVLDEDALFFVPPVVRPDDGKDYEWDEESVSWVEIVPEVTDLTEILDA